MWKKAIENVKLIVTTISLLVSFSIGAWTVITDTFVTKAYAEEQINNFRTEVAYNKAFRLETKIEKLQDIQKDRKLSDAETRELKRLTSNLTQVDKYLQESEIKMFGK